MTDLSGLFSSEAATLAVARREVRSNRDVSKAFERTMKSLFPLAKRFGTRRKVQRDELRPLVMRTFNDLKQEPDIIDPRFRVVRPAPSSNEEYVLTYVFAMASDHSENWMDFIATKVTFCRDEFRIYMNFLDFVVSDHALARYQQRERRPIKTFYHDLMRPMKAAFPLGMRSMYNDIQSLVLPFSSGFFMGETTLAQTKDKICEMRIGIDGQHQRFRDSEVVIGGGRICFNMKTFVDQSRLYDDQEQLLRRFQAYEREYAAELDVIFRVVVFDEGVRHPQDRIMDCCKEAYDIYASPEWQQFLDGRRRALEAKK